MSNLEHLWAGWRGDYVASVPPDDDVDTSVGGCVFCRILTSDLPRDERLVVWEGETAAAVLNLYPYSTGHLMVMPVRHVAALGDLEAEESLEVWEGVRSGVAALDATYSPDGFNVGANLGRVAGAGIPGHLHLHVLPRWGGDTNFMTSVAGTRVMPEALPDTWAKVAAAWPRSSRAGSGEVGTT